MRKSTIKRLIKASDAITAIADELRDITENTTLKDDEMDRLGEAIESAEAAIDKLQEQIGDQE